MKNIISLLDIGSSKVVSLSATVFNQQKCDIIASGLETYDGFLGTSLLNPASFPEVIQKVIAACEKNLSHKTSDFYVGLPSAFCDFFTVDARIDIHGVEPRVTEKDIATVIEEAERTFIEIHGSEIGDRIIHQTPTSFTLDNGMKTFSPKDNPSTELHAKVCFIVAKEEVRTVIGPSLARSGKNIKGMASSSLGQVLLFIPAEERDQGAMLIDVGYTSTEVFSIEGDGITHYCNIPIGGAQIAADISNTLDISFKEAENIKRLFIYDLPVGQDAFEITDAQGQRVEIKREIVEPIVNDCVQEIADAINEAIERGDLRAPKGPNSYLTGGGIVMNRGGREFFSNCLGRTLRELPKKTTKLSNPAYSSTVGLLDLIIDTYKRPTSGGIGGFFRNLFGA